MDNSVLALFVLVTAFAMVSGGITGSAYAAPENVSGLPPAKQVEMGVSPSDVTCKGEQVLLLRTNGDPLCVNPTSVERFVSGGIATVVEARVSAVDVTEAAEASDLVVSMTLLSDHLYDMKQEAKDVVERAVSLYADGGTLDDITADAEMRGPGSLYPVVIDLETMTIEAHGHMPEAVGTVAEMLGNGEKSLDDIKAELESDGSTWVMVPTTHPDTGYDKIKKAYLQLHDGHVFASGFYMTELEADMLVTRWVADSAAALYDEHGADALGMINEASADYAAGDLYPFVLDPETGTILAHGADAQRVGDASVILSGKANKPLDLIHLELELNGGAWVTYTFINFDTGHEELKLTWITGRDNHIFGSGFHPDKYTSDKIDAMMSADNALAIYASGSEDPFAEITALNVADSAYPFVITIGSGDSIEMADGSVLDRRGEVVWQEHEANAAIRDAREALESGRGAFIAYVFLNPDTGEQQAKKAWAVLHDGYLFGAGSYLDGEIAQKIGTKWSVATTVEMYKELGAEDTIAAVNAMGSAHETYPFVLDSDLVAIAHGSNLDIVGTMLFDVVTPDKDAEQIMEDLARSKNARTWITYTFTNPVTGEDAEKRTLLEMHDGYIFGAGYYPANMEVNAVSFDAEERAWLDAHSAIIMAYDPAWPPFEFVDEEGNLAGAAQALVERFSKLAPVEFVMADSVESWDDALTHMLDGTADVLLMAEKTAERSEYMDFTEPWFIIPIDMIVMGDDTELQPTDLPMYDVVTVKSYAVESWLDENMPDVGYYSADSSLDALNMLADGTADVYLEPLLSARYLGMQHGISGFSSAGSLGDEYTLSIGYTQGDDVLGSIMQKLLDATAWDDLEPTINALFLD